jgi:hypothetical protein
MANNDKRLNYFNGQFLQDTDFQTEQAYLLDRQRRHNRLMHTFGIAEGLAVSASVGASTVGVTPGSAIDGQGRQIVLFDPRTLQLGAQSPFVGKTVLVVIAYAEAPSDPAQVGGSGNTRTWENPDVKLVVDDGTAPAPDASLRLARLKLDGGGLVSGAADLSVRVTAGARVGSEVDVPILKLQTPGVDASLWPAFTSNGAGEADLTGTLVVSGDIKVGNAPQAVAVHIADKNNPHGTTAAQVGAITGVGGVANPGGAVSLVAGGAIVITPDNSSNKRITISENHSTNTTNPHSTTAAQVGAIVSVGGVSNPGGPINLAAGGAITINADNFANKRITIGETHSALTGNPHGTTAAQVGAVALTDYDISQRTLTSLSFTNADVDGATKTVTLNFRPRLVWVSGYAMASIGGTSVAGVVTGFARLDSGIGGYCFGPYIQRTGGIPYVIPSIVSSNALARGYFVDGTVSPNGQVDITMTITSVTATGMVVTFNRTTNVGSVAPSGFSIYAALLCLGA